MKKIVKEIALIVLGSSLIGIGVNIPLLIRYAKGEFEHGFLFSDKGSGVIFIGLSETEDILARGDALFVDSRSRLKFRSGHILGAINIPLEENKDGLRQELAVPLEKTLVVYCDGGECLESVGLAKILHDHGFKDIRVFSGGWEEWLKAGLPKSFEND